MRVLKLGDPVLQKFLRARKAREFVFRIRLAEEPFEVFRCLFPVGLFVLEKCDP